jgi:Transcriptional regulator containing an amidase domain and an AraC-type DNA-binding HTH domain
MDEISTINPTLLPLVTVFSQLDSWLVRDGVSRIVVAAPTVPELDAQKLNAPVRTSLKPRKGKRQIVKLRRHFTQPQVILARWPEDALEETTLYCIACVLRGQADFNIADYVLHAKAGDWVLFPPGVPKQDHTTSHFEGDPTNRFCDILWISTGLIKDEGLRCWVCRSEGTSHRGQGDLGSCWAQHPMLAPLFVSFAEEMQSERRLELATHLLHAAVLLLLSEVRTGRVLPQWGKLPAASTDKRIDPIADALAYMENNLEKSLTIASVAHHVSISQATFTRHFRQRTGQSFQEYHTQLRLKRATQLLLETDISIYYVCYLVGLKYGQLRKLFQQHHNCSPGEFSQTPKLIDK